MAPPFSMSRLWHHVSTTSPTWMPRFILSLSLPLFLSSLSSLPSADGLSRDKDEPAVSLPLSRRHHRLDYLRRIQKQVRCADLLSRPPGFHCPASGLYLEDRPHGGSRPCGVDLLLANEDAEDRPLHGSRRAEREARGCRHVEGAES